MNLSGWFEPVRNPEGVSRAHFFRDGRSLCGTWISNPKDWRPGSKLRPPTDWEPLKLAMRCQTCKAKEGKEKKP